MIKHTDFPERIVNNAIIKGSDHMNHSCDETQTGNKAMILITIMLLIAMALMVASLFALYKERRRTIRAKTRAAKAQFAGI